jgi:uncharacterized protein
MIAPASSRGRLRAYLEFLAAVLCFFVARSVARHAALGLASDAWSPLVEQIILVFLLVVGYACIGFWVDRQSTPISQQGLPRRAGFTRESGLGIAFGWAIVVVCVLTMAIFGGIAISITPRLSSWGWLIVDAFYFAFAALAEEIAFRGYAFQAFVRAVGPIGATLGFAVFCAILQQLVPGASHASFAVAMAFTILLSTAYLRSRALWVSWGINFGWKASQALLFGLAVRGVAGNSPVVQGDPMGSFWLTGGAFGLDGSWFAFLVLLAAIPFLFRVTRDLDYRYNAPMIVPGGVPVDIEAAARAQHEAAVGTASAPAAPALVQINASSPMQGNRPSALPEDRSKDS